MLIKQCNLTPPLKHSGHFWEFLEYWKLHKYSSPTKPVVFFGLYDSINDINKIKSHQSLAVVVWIGCDILKKSHLRITKKLPYVKHVAISAFIEKDLKKAGIPYTYLPLRGRPKENLRPAILGDEIYTYLPKSKKKKNFLRYGGRIVKKIKSKIKYKINIISDPHQYDSRQLKKIYKRCFCGLRLTDHDGLSNTVVELGLMGRKCFTNDYRLPNSIPWSPKKIDDIIMKIDELSHHIGEVDYETANNVYNHVTLSNKWLNPLFWGKV